MTRHEVPCILCPVSCHALVDEDEHGNLSISHLECSRGEGYVTQEVQAPLRDVFTTIPITGALVSRLPVRTRHPVPKHEVKNCLRALATVTISAPVTIGTVIVPNLLNLGIDVIATRTLAQRESKSP